MSPTLIASIAGLVTAACWGTSDYLSAKGSKRHGVLEINFVVETLGLAIAAVLFFVYGVHVSNVDQLIRIALSNILLTSAYMIFVKALATGAVGIIVPLGNIYPLFTIALSIAFLGERFKTAQLLAMVTIVVGAMVLAYEKNTKKIPLKKLHKETLLALLAAITWGLSFFVLNPVVQQVTWQTVSVVGEIFAAAFAFLLLIANRRRQSLGAIRHAFESKPALGVGVIGVGGTIVLYFGSSRAGNVAIPTVLSAAGPLIASLWAAVIDHERLGYLKRLGAGIVVAGIIILNAA